MAKSEYTTAQKEEKTAKVKVKDMTTTDAVPVLRRMHKKAEKGGRKRRARALELAIALME